MPADGVANGFPFRSAQLLIVLLHRGVQALAEHIAIAKDPVAHFFLR